MKHLLLITLIAFSLLVKAQDEPLIYKTFPSKDGDIHYQQIFDSLKFDKTELYNRSRIFLVETFNSSKAVIEYESKEEGIIMGKGLSKIYFQYSNLFGFTTFVHYTIKIRVKDNKAAIDIYDFRMAYDIPATQYSVASSYDRPFMEYFNPIIEKKGLKPLYVEYLNTVDKRINTIIDSYKNALSKEIKPDGF